MQGIPDVAGHGQFAVASDYLVALLNLAGEQGLSAEKCLADSGLSPQILIKGVKRVGSISLRIVTATLLKHFSLEELTCRFLDSLGVLHHGPLSIAIQAAESLEEALTIVSQYVDTRTAGKRLQYTRSKTHHCIELTGFAAPVEEDAAVDRFIVMTSLLSIAKGLALLLDPDHRAAQISFDFSLDRPDLIADHFSLFDMAFGQKGSAIRWRKGAKLRPVITDRALFRSAIQECEALKETVTGEDEIASRVRFELSRADTPNLSMEEVAARLFMSPRTLQRKLAQAGLHFRDIRASEHHKRALYYLEHSNLSVESIARTLGYSHPSNFIRSFKTAMGVLPGEYRDSKSGKS